MSLSAQRAGADRCPGALQLHTAADGELARVRLPGGRLSRDQLAVLRDASVELGDGTLELTSRANIQIRGLSGAADLAERLAGAGLLPSATHERVRNILASPLSGLDDRGYLDVYPLVAALDSAICDTSGLAGLPGRFLFAIDDGRRDVIGLGADVGLLALASDVVAVVLSGRDSGLRVRPSEAVEYARAAAEAFLVERAAQGSTAWRLDELTDGPAAVASRLGGHASGQTFDGYEPTAIGPQVVGVPLGRLNADQATALIKAAVGDLRITPWRSVVVPGGAPTNVGLITDSGSALLGITACTGKPGCVHALADVRRDAARSASPGRRAVHWAGCARRCGRPVGSVVDVVANEAGYDVSVDDQRQVSGVDRAGAAQVIRGLR